eukprot:GABV01007640.1.p2 GENE.GABV01007640.1~~GABV01007640.1.p2  ORF type:complete len:127 (-),score=32.75 GABV01007640.1:3-353(-)
MQNERHSDARELMVHKAWSTDLNLTLENRLEFLGRALTSARAVPVMYADREANKVFDLEDTISLCKLQLDVQMRLKDLARGGEEKERDGDVKMNGGGRLTPPPQRRGRRMDSGLDA